MFFEGTEKKIELIIRGANLRSEPESFWRGMVEAANAKIISKISNDACDAFLLSESSLFVWDERLTMITCGTTTLVNAADYFFARVPSGEVDFFIYVRKNEYFPAAQATDFSKDAALLSERVPGKAERFGAPDQHHMFVYHLDKDFRPGPADGTLEVLMHKCETQTIEQVRTKARLESLFPDFQIDDFIFEPSGYSLNAIRGAEYFTVHVSPEETHSYVSFVTNVALGARAPAAIRDLLALFRPRLFDVISFDPERGYSSLDLTPFRQNSADRRHLNGGFEAGFAHYEALPLEG